jgi:hypothetical protein
MIKRILLALALLLFAQPALADTWTVGQQPISFLPVGTNVVGDGTTTQGGIAPAYENGSNPFEPADIADNFAPAYTTAAQTRCTYPVGNTAGAVNCAFAASEAKFRTLCNFGFVGQFDMIVFPGQNNVGHLHMFSGNLAAAYNSDYSQLRQNGESTCAGNKNNRSAYWAPALLIDLPTGYTAVFKFVTQTVYYTLNPASLYQSTSRIPRNFAYIGGYDPSDPNNTKLTVPLAAANTPGCVGGGCRYALPSGLGAGTSSATGFVGWRCLTSDLSTGYDGHTVNAPLNSSTQPYLRNAAGQATLACPVNGGLLAEILMPDCWDGKNLHSGGSTGGGVGGINLPSSSGRLHVSYRLHDNNTGLDVCPTGTWQIPVFQTKYIWAIGTTDVSKLYLSSDVMNYGAPDATSRSPCRQVSSHYCYGETFHSDWFGAWGYGTAAAPGIMMKWLNHCNGVKIIDSTGTLTSDPGECDTSTIDSTTALQVSGTTSGGLPFGNPSVSYTGTARYVPVVAGSTGAGHLHHGIPCTTSTPCQSMNDNMPMPANDNQLAGVAPVSFDLRRVGR